MSKAALCVLDARTISRHPYTLFRLMSQEYLDYIKLKLEQHKRAAINVSFGLYARAQQCFFFLFSKLQDRVAFYSSFCSPPVNCRFDKVCVCYISCRTCVRKDAKAVESLVEVTIHLISI
jgi:hypothetical protein